MEASGSREWPLRPPGQPVFYPVLNEEYAIRAGQLHRGMTTPAAEFKQPPLQTGMSLACHFHSWVRKLHHQRGRRHW